MKHSTPPTNGYAASVKKVNVLPLRQRNHSDVVTEEMRAKRGNKNALGNKGGGRKPKYTKQHAVIARKLWTNGATVADLAYAFDVAHSTIWAWQAQHVEFAESLRAGKDQFDDIIENALAQRARGYEYQTEKVFQHDGEIIRAKITEHVPADVSAAKFWLLNRRSAKYRSEAKIIHDSAPGAPLPSSCGRSTAHASSPSSAAAPVIEGEFTQVEPDTGEEP